jgi:hypothetical protein
MSRVDVFISSSIAAASSSVASRWTGPAVMDASLVAAGARAHDALIVSSRRRRRARWLRAGIPAGERRDEMAPRASSAKNGASPLRRDAAVPLLTAS